MSDFLKKIKELSTPICAKHEKVLVDVLLRKEFGINVISIVIDDLVTFSLDIDEVAIINQEILDVVNDYIPDGYYLEVTSVGIERELLNENDYLKAIGKYIYIKTYQKLSSFGDLKEFYGDLLNYENGLFTLEITNKTRKQIVEINKVDIAKIRLAVKF